MSATEAQIRQAVALAASAVEEAARAAGPLGAPSGVVYAVLNARGMRYETYVSLISGMERMGKIWVDGNHCIHLGRRGA